MEASLGPSPSDDTNTKIEALSILSRNDKEPLLSSKNKSNTARNKYNQIILLSILLFLLCIAGISIWVIFLIDIFEKASSQIIYDDGPSGLFGKWPIYGGNLENQQISPSNVSITSDNIENLSFLCSYKSINGESFDGYIVIDDNNNAYFADYSGYITCVNLDFCNEIWRKNIAQLLGYNMNSIKIVSRNSVTLYIDNSTRRKSVLLATPNKRIQSRNYPDSFPCWLLSLDARSGELIWKIDLSTDNPKETYLCHAHGFIVDNDGIYGYGGISVFGWITSSPRNQDIHFNQFKGRLIKIDLLRHKIIDEFYTIPKHKNDDILFANISNNGYIGGGIWNIPAMIDDYIVFGSGDLLSYPDYITDCFNGIADLNNSYHFNPCGQDVINNPYWKCLENDIYIDSLIVLNKTNMELIISIPLQGVDAWNYACEYDDKLPPCPSYEGSDSDLAAISVMRSHVVDGIYYAIAHQKSGMFYMIEIPSGEVLISKKIGPWSSTGGANSFSLALDSINNIAITAITGGFDKKYKYKTADNNIICETGSIHAIDLNTGYTLWQIINPYGRSNRFDNNQCNNSIYNQYIDWSFVNMSLCERGYNKTEMLSANQTCIGECVIYPDIIDIDNEPVQFAKDRGKFYGGITIANDMVFIPSISGDIFVHNIINGTFIYRLTCPNTTNHNRPAVGGGVTVIDDKIIFYCGRRIQSRITGNSQQGNQLISMQLFNCGISRMFYLSVFVCTTVLTFNF